MSDVFELPLVLQNEYNTVLAFAMPMCVIKTEPKLEPWLKENLINILASYHDHLLIYDGWYFKDFGDQFFVHSKLYKNTLPYEQMDIPAYLMQQLRVGRFYINIRLDEYYLSCQWYFQREHHSHSSLLYGYDLSTREFLAYSIDRNRNYSKLRYSFDEVTEAFRSTLRAMPDVADTPTHNEAIWLFKLKKLDYAYPFSVERFTQRLADYCHGTNRSAENYTVPDNLPWSFPYMPYGLQAVKRFIDYLEKPEPLSFENFKDLYFLYEQKKGLLSRLQYVCDIEGVPADLRPLVNAYEEVVQLANIARMKYLKSEHVRDRDKLLAIRQSIRQHMQNYTALEENLLTQMLEILNFYTPPTLPEEPNVADWARKTLIEAEDARCNIYPYHRHIRYEWEEDMPLYHLRLAPRSFNRIVLDNGQTIDFVSTNESDTTLVTLPFEGGVCRSLELHMYSHFDIDPDTIDFRIHGADLARYGKAHASGSWPTEDGRHDPDKAINGDGDTFWSATADWQPGTYWEVQFDCPTSINCVLLKERTRVNRLQEYAIAYIDAEGREVELLRHCGGLHDQPIRHDFNPVTTERLRVVFYRCDPDEAGNREPTLSRFEAYNIPNVPVL